MDLVSAHMGGANDNHKRTFLHLHNSSNSGSSSNSGTGTGTGTSNSNDNDTALLELSRSAAASNRQPFYLGEYTVTITTNATRTGTTGGINIDRSYGYAESVIDWVLSVHRKGLGGLLASMWVFEYKNQNSTFSLTPGRDGTLLKKLKAANGELASL